MFGLIRLRCQGNQKFFKRELNAFNTPLSDVSFLELISDAIKTCLIFGCSCSSRAVSYFCHNSLRTNCLESTLFVCVWSSQSNQAVTDIYSTLPQSWMELIFVQMNGLSASVSACWDGDDLCCCDVKAYLSILWRSLSVSVHTVSTKLWRETIFIWIGITSWFSSWQLLDCVTSLPPSGPPSTLANYSVSPALAGSCTHIDQSA